MVTFFKKKFNFPVITLISSNISDIFKLTRRTINHEYLNLCLMFDACCLQLVHNISQFCHNTSWCSLSFPEVLIVEFSSHRLNLKINRIILTSSMSKLHFRWSRNKPYLLFYSFNFWSKLLASSTGPSSRKLRSEWRLSSEGMFCTSIWLEYESRKIFFEDCTLLLMKENSCFKKAALILLRPITVFLLISVSFIAFDPDIYSFASNTTIDSYIGNTCCPSELCICSSPSFLHARDQLPTMMRPALWLDKIGWLLTPLLTWLLAFWSFSRNSPLFSVFRRKDIRIIDRNCYNVTKVNKPRNEAQKKNP